MPRLKGESQNFIDRTAGTLGHLLKTYFEEKMEAEAGLPPGYMNQSMKDAQAIEDQDSWMHDRELHQPYGANSDHNQVTMEQVYKRIADQLFIESIKRQGGFYPSPETIIKRNKK